MHRNAIILAKILAQLDGAAEGPAPHSTSALLRELADLLDEGGTAPDVKLAIAHSEVMTR